MIELLAKGIIIGFVIAVPVGPASVMVIQRTLTRSRIHGIIAGVGAGIADTLFGAIAAFGLSWIQDWLVTYVDWIRLIGGTVLVLKGAMLTRAPVADPAQPRESGLWGALVTTFMLTMTNPITVFAFFGIMAVFHVVSENLTLADASMLSGAVFVGAMIWWLTLVALSGFFRTHLQGGRMVWVNRLAGSILVACGILLLYSFYDPSLLDTATNASGVLGD